MPNSCGRGSVPLLRCSPTDAMNYYILFDNFDQGLAMHDLLTASGFDNRIAPTPRSIQGELSCGMSLLIRPEALEAVRECIVQNRAACHAIVPYESPLRANRDRYC